MKKFCEGCGHEITSWYFTYDGKYFCRDKDDRCIKEYLMDKFEDDIELDLEGAEYGPRMCRTEDDDR